MFLPCPEIPALDADRNWVRRQLNQLALEQNLPDEVHVGFSGAIDRATWRSELQNLTDRLTASPCPPPPRDGSSRSPPSDRRLRHDLPHVIPGG